MPLKHILLTLLVVAIWGFNFVPIKLSVEAMPPLLAAGLRFALAAFPAILFVKFPRTHWLFVAGFGLSFGVGLYVFLNFALANGMPAGLGSVVLQVQAFFTMLIAFAVLGERPRPVQLVGAAIAFGGIALIGWERFEGATFLPFVLTLGAALSWGSANVISKSAGPVNSLGLAAWGSVFATIPLIGMSLVIDGPEPLVAMFVSPSLWDWSLIAFIAYPATLFALATWSHLLSQHPASTVAPFTLLVPITGLGSGWLLLGETISPVEIAGGALVVAGIGVTVIRRRQAAQRTAETLR